MISINYYVHMRKCLFLGGLKMAGWVLPLICLDFFKSVDIGTKYFGTKYLVSYCAS